MWILALDVGTSSIRAIGYDAAGRALPGADARVGYEPAITADGGSELDSEELVAATASAVDRCLAAAPGPPGAVAGSVFWHSLLALDAGGHPLAGVITWADTRSGAAATALRARLDPTAVHARTGAPLHSTFFPAKLTWLRETRPEVFARGHVVRLRRIPAPASHGTPANERQHGLGHRAPGPAGGRMGRADARRLRHRPRASPAHRRYARDRARARVERPLAGLAAVPWLPAAGDGACSNLGADCSGPGRIALNVGTSAALRLVTDAPRAVPWGLWHYRVDARRHLIGGATSEGGNVVAWARRTLALRADDGALDTALAAVPPDSHGLTALPFLAGERSPGWRGDARAAVSGVSLATTAQQILRALVEAVAYRLAAVYDRLRPLAAPGHAVIATGGALGHSRAWPQILADALGVPIEVREDMEASSRGAALLALAALGCPAPPSGPSGTLVRPDPRRRDIYAAARARQDRLYDSVVGPRVT